MKITSAAIVTLSFLNLSSGNDEADQDIVILNADNFEAIIEQHRHILVEFHTRESSGHETLTVEFAKAARILEEEDSDIKLAKVDSTVDKTIAELYGVQQYPTVKFFRHRIAIKYTGETDAQSIAQWAEHKKTVPIAATLVNLAAVKSFIGKNQVAIIGFFTNQKSIEARAFLEAAWEVEDFEFAITSNVNIFSKYQVPGDKIVMFKKFDEIRVDYNGTMDTTNITLFVKRESVPLVAELSHENMHQILHESSRYYQMLLFANKIAADFKNIMGEFTEAAKYFKGKISFLFINTNEAENGDILKFFTLTNRDIATVRLNQKIGGNIIKSKPTFTELLTKNFIQFGKDALEDKLKPQLLAQDVPEDWDAYPVKVLTAKNFENIALDQKKSVLVAFYSLLNVECLLMSPLYDELGAKFQNNNTIVIAKMDASLNELENIKIHSIPILKYFPAGSDQVIDYIGEKSLEGVTKFLESGGREGAAPLEENTPSEEGIGNEEKDADNSRKEEL